MIHEIETNYKQARLKIDGEMTIEAAASLHKSLVVYFDGYDDLILELAHVEKCDAAGVQLILSARKTAALMNKTFTVANVSLAVIEGFARSGLQPENHLDI